LSETPGKRLTKKSQETNPAVSTWQVLICGIFGAASGWRVLRFGANFTG